MRRTRFPFFSKIPADVVLFLFFWIGLCYGVGILIKNEAILKKMIDYSIDFAGNLRKISFFQQFFASFCTEFFFLLCYYLLGFSAIGRPFTFLLFWGRGLGLGALLGGLYHSQSLRGVLFCSIAVLPQAIASLFVLLLAGRESMQLSHLFFDGFFPGNDRKVNGECIRRYHQKFLLLAAFLLGFTLCCSILCRVFLHSANA